MAAFVLPFEKPVVDLVERVRQLRDLAASDAKFEPELKRLEEKAGRLAREIFADLTPMQKVMISRHPNRPYTLDYVQRLFTDWIELHGDRRFADDASIVAGLARFHERSVVVVGHQKGRGTKENMVGTSACRDRRVQKSHPDVRARRQVQPADPHVRRHARSLSVHRRRRARAERGDRSRPCRDGQGRGPHRGDHHRRGGLGRGARARRRQPRSRPRVRVLFGHLARRVRRHPLEGRCTRGGGGRAAEDDGTRLAAARRRGQHRRRARGRRAPRSRRGCQAARARPLRGALLDALGPGELAQDRYQRFRKLGAVVA